MRMKTAVMVRRRRCVTTTQTRRFSCRAQGPVPLFLLLLTMALSGCVTSVAPAPVAPRADGGASTPRELIVFAAASLTDAMTELEQLFEAANPGIDVLMNFGGSSRLATQLQEGAPADVFASANETQMANVVDAGLVGDGPHLFASNRLVIITPAANPAGITTPADLAQPGISLILAVPGVPVRDYSAQIIAGLSTPDGLGVDFADAVYANLVSEEDNVRQVVAKVALGEADAGMVYTSDVTPDVADALLTVAIPDAVNVIATYPIAPLTGGNAPDLGAAFVDLVLSDAGRTVLAKWGFGPVHAPADE